MWYGSSRNRDNSGVKVDLYLSLGSNQGDRRKNIEDALSCLNIEFKAQYKAVVLLPQWEKSLLPQEPGPAYLFLGSYPQAPGDVAHYIIFVPYYLSQFQNHSAPQSLCTWNHPIWTKESPRSAVQLCLHPPTHHSHPRHMGRGKRPEGAESGS